MESDLLKKASQRAAEKYHENRQAISSDELLMFAEVIGLLLEWFRDCRERRSGQTDGEAIVDTVTNSRSFRHIRAARKAVREVHGRIGFREVKKRADAVLDAAEDSEPEEIDALYYELESR